MRSYPIWNEVNACIYSSGKSFGAKDTSETRVKVGTSASNSVELVRHVTTRREQGAYTVFRFGVDCGTTAGLQILKTLWMHTKSQKWYESEPEELKELVSK